MERRSFLAWMGVGWLASSLPVALAACSNSETTRSAPDAPSAASPVTTGPQTVGTVADLDRAGQLLKKDLAVGPVLVVRDPTDGQKLVAVNPTCTHKGCLIAWEAKEQVFICPCHGARFGSAGQVVKGPAEKPLKTYTATIDGNTIQITG